MPPAQKRLLVLIHFFLNATENVFEAASQVRKNGWERAGTSILNLGYWLWICLNMFISHLAESPLIVGLSDHVHVWSHHPDHPDDQRVRKHVHPQLGSSTEPIHPPRRLGRRHQTHGVGQFAGLAHRGPSILQRLVAGTPETLPYPVASKNMMLWWG